MLTELCAEIRNYFLRDYRKDIHVGKFTISDGDIEALSFLQVGQYFRIVGSVFNDGVYKYGEGGLHDEVFTGAVWAMAVPPAVIALSEEIDNWIAENGEVLSSPFVSESFGGYSYSKRSNGSSKRSNGSSQGNSESAFGWKDQFASQLNRYRRISVL